MKRLFLALTLFALPSFANDASVNQAAPYLSIGAGPLPLPLPSFGIGYRTQHNYLGLDLSAKVQPLIIFTIISERAVATYYPNPNADAQIYLGAGVGLHATFNHIWSDKTRFDGLDFSPEFTVGRQYKSKDGHNRTISADLSIVDREPIFTLNYGYGF